MIWLVIAVVVLVVVAALVMACLDTPSDAAYYRAAVNLHATRRRRELVQLKGEVRRDGTRARRELRQELGALKKRER